MAIIVIIITVMVTHDPMAIIIIITVMVTHDQMAIVIIISHGYT